MKDKIGAVVNLPAKISKLVDIEAATSGLPKTEILTKIICDKYTKNSAWVLSQVEEAAEDLEFKKNIIKAKLRQPANDCEIWDAFDFEGEDLCLELYTTPESDKVRIFIPYKKIKDLQISKEIGGDYIISFELGDNVFFKYLQKFKEFQISL